MENQEEYLLLSGIQHFAFCRRQWALIHLEQSWGENVHTVLGELVHNRAHDAEIREHRGDTIIVRGLAVRSQMLGLSGECDVVEFHKSAVGHPLSGEDGLWLPTPVEYKKGYSKITDIDRLQLCAQAMCLEEMFCVDIPKGYLYYNTTKSREKVIFGENLRSSTNETAFEMHKAYMRGITPAVKKKKACKSCSLKDICLPELPKRTSVAEYVSRFVEEQT